MKKMIAFLLSFVLMFGSISAFAVSNEDTNDSRMSCVQEIDEDEIQNLPFVRKCALKIKEFFVFCFTFGGGSSEKPGQENGTTSSDSTSSDCDSSVPPESDTDSSKPPESNVDSSSPSDLPSSGPDSDEVTPPGTDDPDTNVPGNDNDNIQDEPSDEPELDNELLNYANEVVKLVNEERAKNGLSALSVDVNVQKAAQVRAEEQKRLFSHTRPNGTSCFTALKENGVSYRGAGENIAMGQRSPEQVMNGWMNSKGHRANILSNKFTSIGVGVYKDLNGKYYWTQMFIY